MDVESTEAVFESNENETLGGNEMVTALVKKAESETSFDFTERTWKEDFALIVENRKLYVAKNILALASPVFDKMFQADFKEKDLTELELPDKKFDDVQDFLRCIYPGCVADVSDKNVYRVLPLAEEYQVPGLKSKCERILINSLNESTIDEVYNTLGLAITYNMEDLSRKCITKVSEKPIENLDSALKRMSLPLKSVCEIQDKMVRRLEQSEAGKKRIEGVYRYLLPGLSANEKRAIEKCEGWTGKSLQFSITVEELKSSQRTTQPKTFRLFDIEVVYSVQKDSNNYYLSVQFSSDENKLRGLAVTVLGRFVVRCGTTLNPDFTTTFEMSLRDGSAVQTADLYGSNDSFKPLFDQRNGFIHNGKMNAEMHLLADRKNIE